MVSYSCCSRRKAKLIHNTPFLFHNPNINTIFMIDTGSAISMILPCRCYRKYFDPQNLIAANGTPIYLFGTKKLNINAGACYKLGWIFRVANVDIPIISNNFLHHFSLDIVNNSFILPHNSVHHQHNTLHLTVNYVNHVSCISASDAIKSPPLSPSLTNVTN